MKHRLLALALALALCLGLCALPVAASFSDVTDARTGRNVEILRLMGVLEGDGQGRFRPDEGLTRAQFCKMCVVLMGKRGDSARYAARTIFPDVRASHWAAPFVNFAAASGETAFIHGMPDGTFAPESPITFGQAATILMRLLGYEDKDAGGLWPEGYLKLAEGSGVSQDLNLGGGDAITRAQAAQLFVNTLYAKTKSGSLYYENLGMLGEETVLLRVDGTNGRLYTEDKTEGYPMVFDPDGSLFVGMRGRVLLDAAGKALTFLPRDGASGSPVTEAAIILSEDGSTAGFEALSGGRSIEGIYRNGVRVEASALRKYDVAGYSLADNCIHVCDTRLRVCYEDCTPSPTEPVSVQVMGGTSLNVLPTARQSLSRFKPGEELVLLLSSDGRVAGARAVNEGAAQNAMAYVDREGKTFLICGETLLPLGMRDAALSDWLGEAVLLYQTSTQNLTQETLYRQYVLRKLEGGVPGALDAEAGTVGNTPVNRDAMILLDGSRVYLEALKGRYGAEQVRYAKLGADGRIDLIVLSTESSEGVFYGRAVLTEEQDFTLGYMQFLSLDTGTRVTEKYQCNLDLKEGEVVRAEVRGGKYVSVTRLTASRDVPSSAWIGESAVVLDGMAYPVSAKIPCFNLDTGKWMSGLAAAKAYDERLDLYVADGAVRLIAAGG